MNSLKDPMRQRLFHDTTDHFGLHLHTRNQGIGFEEVKNCFKHHENHTTVKEIRQPSTNLYQTERKLSVEAFVDMEDEIKFSTADMTTVSSSALHFPGIMTYPRRLLSDWFTSPVQRFAYITMVDGTCKSISEITYILQLRNMVKFSKPNNYEDCKTTTASLSPYMLQVEASTINCTLERTINSKAIYEDNNENSNPGRHLRINDDPHENLKQFLNRLGYLYFQILLIFFSAVKFLFPSLKWNLNASGQSNTSEYTRVFQSVTEQRTFQETNTDVKTSSPTPALYEKVLTHQQQVERVADTQSDPFTPRAGSSKRPEDLCREIYRITTFETFPQDIRINPSVYAKAGFYYLGTNDLVKCFACENIIDNLTPLIDPFLLRYHKNSCKFARQTDDCGNVPFNTTSRVGAGQSTSMQRRPAGELLLSRGPTSSSQPNNPNVSQSPIPTNFNRSSSGATRNATYQTAQPTSQISPSASLHPPYPPPSYQSQFPVMRELASIVDPNHERFIRTLSLNKEADRFQSFTSLWSTTNSPSPRSMARAGWFYLGNLDRTQCFVCGQVLRNWRRSDDPAEEHQRHFPGCTMAQGNDPHNVRDRTETQTQRPVRRTNLSEQERMDLRDMFPCSHPANQNMRSHQNRAATFRNWPYTRATPNMIAEAGFYSLGDGDRVKCFYCNGGLQNWKLNDDPWEEHAKWYPTCEYILQHRGPEYIHSVVTRYPDLARPVLRAPGQDVPPSQLQTVESGPEWIDEPVHENNPNAEEDLKKKLLTEAMQSDVAKTVIGMGFDESIVHKLMQDNIEQNGAAYQSASALFDAVFEYQSTLEMEETPPAPAQELPHAGASTSRESRVESPVEELYESGGIDFGSSEYSPSITSGVQESLHPSVNEIPDESPHNSFFGNSISASNNALLNPLSPHSGRMNPNQQRHHSGPPRASHLDQPTSSRSASMPEPRDVRRKVNPEELKKTLEQLEDQKLCKVCLDREADVVFIPCGHICCCMECTRALRACPMCRVRIERAVRTYTS